MKLYSELGSLTGSGFTDGFDSVIGSNFAAKEHFLPAILRLVVGSSRWYDQLRCTMYMNIAIVGNLSSNVQIPHNCNTGQVRDLVFLLFLGILCEILLTAGTMAEPIVVAGDSSAAEHSALPEHIVATVEPSTSDYTVATM